MQYMIKKLGLLISLILILTISFASPTYAHPGATAADGCHYCRTNCDKWGVPWNERHCHGGGAVQAPVVKQSQPIVVTNSPVPTKKIVKKPTKKPAKTVKRKATPTKKPTSTVTPKTQKN